MSTAVAERPAKPLLAGPSHFLLRRFHSLTGIAFGLYVLAHLAVNATLVEGIRYAGEPTVYQLQVDKIHQLPFLKMVSYTFLILPIVYHTIYGIYVTFNGRQNVVEYGYTRNWLYLLQRISAIILILFIAFHYFSFKGAFDSLMGDDSLHFVPAQASESTIRHLQSRWWIGWFVYPVGIVAATFHTANGFYAAGIAWGLTVTAGAQRRWGYVCAVLFLILTGWGFMAIGAGIRHGKIDAIDAKYPRVENRMIREAIQRATARATAQPPVGAAA